MHFEVAEKNSGLFAESRDVFKESPRLSEEDCGLLRESDTLPSEKEEGAMKKRGRNKSGSLFSRGRKERAEKKRGSGGRLCLVDRPEKTAGRRNSKTSAAKKGRSPVQKGISAPLSPLRLPNARRRCRAPRSCRRRQPAAFPAHSVRPICGRGDFRIRPAHKWH